MKYDKKKFNLNILQAKLLSFKIGDGSPKSTSILVSKSPSCLFCS